MRSIRKILGAGVLAAALVGGSALAAGQEGLVNVDVSDVRVDIAKDINVDVSQIPVTVQAPIDVAANVCGVAVTALGEAGQATACKAKSTNSALNDVVQDQVKEQN